MDRLDHWPDIGQIAHSAHLFSGTYISFWHADRPAARARLSGKMNGTQPTISIESLVEGSLWHAVIFIILSQGAELVTTTGTLSGGCVNVFYGVSIDLIPSSTFFILTLLSMVLSIVVVTCCACTSDGSRHISSQISRRHTLTVILAHLNLDSLCCGVCDFVDVHITRSQGAERTLATHYYHMCILGHTSTAHSTSTVTHVNYGLTSCSLFFIVLASLLSISRVATTTLSAKQDSFCTRTVKGLPQLLAEALAAAQLSDEGLLRSHARSSLKEVGLLNIDVMLSDLWCRDGSLFKEKPTENEVKELRDARTDQKRPHRRRYDGREREALVQKGAESCISSFFLVLRVICSRRARGKRPFPSENKQSDKSEVLG